MDSLGRALRFRFDPRALRGGDAWDASIRRQINKCALFVPVISANTQVRAEGYFRLPRTHLPAGEASAAFAERVQRLLAGDHAAASTATPPRTVPATGPLSTAPAAAAATDEPPSIAVLPFVNLGRNEDDEYFADGLAEELLNVLGKIRGLRVSARSSSFTFKGKGATVAEVGRALNVATVLEGSVRKSGNRMRISVQMVKVADGYHLWSETYDRTLEDIVAVQDDIAQSVLKELRTTLLGETQDATASKQAVAVAAKGRSTDPEAHRLFLQARYFIDRSTRDDTKKGIGYLKEALALAPGNALVLHQSGWLVGNMGRFDEGIALARRAVEQDPLSAPAYFSLGMILWAAERRAEAVTALRKTLELAPQFAAAHGWLSIVLLQQGGNEEALAEALQEPEEWGQLFALAVIHHAAGRQSDSDRALRDLAEKCGGIGADQVAQAHAWRGETSLAFEWLERAYIQRDAGIFWTRIDPLLLSLHPDPRWDAFLRKLGFID